MSEVLSFAGLEATFALTRQAAQFDTVRQLHFSRSDLASILGLQEQEK
jgi:hypothetical protein